MNAKSIARVLSLESVHARGEQRMYTDYSRVGGADGHAQATAQVTQLQSREKTSKL